MRWIGSFVLALAAFAAAPAQAQSRTVVYVEEWVEVGNSATRFVMPPAVQADERAIAAYGPFRVLDDRTAALVGSTDARTPGLFAAMMRDFPGIVRLDMIECAGTADDRSNLQLGRMIRAAGLMTRVPDGGSVRSGGVELFLAGANREVDDGAEFAVHAWQDEDGLQASDYSESASENAKYLVYYREMGMSAEQARAFYAMTNSVPFEQARWIDAGEMRQWIGQDARASAPKLAYLDLGLLLN
ncbi:alpha/beta hydrolase [Altererythrobacter salegens]|uniref:Alpha/beta hydrolase n=1 Tax=Croceibacterium salegens TaxID=1737568 RepID=A0A6I4T001_9SPHN|nr:alpha/beta hydrolase [Croceibacterium salegens]MXO60800.1 alpha/beta hydrolase [Croceibacterium salegens]